MSRRELVEDLLFLAHRIPYPPNKGDKIRSFHLLEYLSTKYRVHLGAFIDDRADRRFRGDVARYCASQWLGEISPFVGKVRSLAGFVTREPLTLPYYGHARLHRWVEDVRARHSVRRALVYSSAMAQYVMGGECDDMRRVIDFVDVDSDKWRQYSRSKSFPMSWVFRREAKRLAAFERQVAMRFDASLFVSDAEVALFKGTGNGDLREVFAIPNGVSMDYFSPDPRRPSPYEQGPPSCVFVGAMDYWANEEGATWFARSVLPMIQQAYPTAVFYIVGMNPTPSVRALARLPGVIVTGAVPDVRPYLQHAAVVVVPLRIARGIQNKILEAMAMGRAVVATPQAFEGIAAEAGRDVLVADGAERFAAAVLRVLRGGAEAIGASARATVKRGLTWEASLPKIVELIEGRA